MFTMRCCRYLRFPRPRGLSQPALHTIAYMDRVKEVEPCKTMYKPNTKPPRMGIVMSSMCIVTAAQLQHIQDVCQ